MPVDPFRSLSGARRLRPLRAYPFRCVESQHLISTRKLVDSDDEQRLLEDLVESAKPSLPAAAPKGLHYLLATPFRYPPLRHGSRFGTRLEPGIFYASLERRAAFAETAYYRLLFLEGSQAALAPLDLEFSVFRVRVKTHRGLDLTRPPFAARQRELSSRTDYRLSQALGRSLRDAGVEAFTYRSARDEAGGKNLAVLSPLAFAERKPSGIETWWCRVELHAVEFVRKSHFERAALRFLREQFLVRGRLPHPSI